MAKSIPMSKDMYEYWCTMPGPPPIGYIEGVGYANYYPMVTMEPNDRFPVAFTTRYDHFAAFVYIPYLITNDEIMNTIMSPHFIKKNVIAQNPDGSCFVNTFDGNIHTVRNCKEFRIYTDTENNYGVEQCMLVVEITTGNSLSTSEKYTFKIGIADIIPKMPDWFDLEQNALTYASFIVGSASFRAGRHYEKAYAPSHNSRGYAYGNSNIDQVMRNSRKSAFAGKRSLTYSMRPTRNGVGYGYNNATFDNILRNTGSKGYGSISHLYPYFKYGGIALGVYSIWRSKKDMDNELISPAQGYTDMFFGVVGFCGWPGLIISTYYFLTISPYIDDHISVERHDSLSFQADNTRVSLPPCPEPIFLPEGKRPEREERPVIIPKPPGNM